MVDFHVLRTDIENAFKHKIPFVVYRKPNKDYVKAIIQNNDDIHYFTDAKQSGFIFAPFNSNEKTIVFPLANSNYIEAKYSENSIAINTKRVNSPTTEDKTKHLDLVLKTLNFIKTKQSEKVVISRKEKLKIPNFSFIKTFEKLINTYKSAFVYVWYHPHVGLWLGATPEQLVTIKNKLFETVSLAGTQSYKDTLDVTWGLKELEEQQIVTDYIESCLKPLVDKLSVAETTTLRAGNLLHLCTKVSGNLKSNNDISVLLNALHPTPATCGLPRDISKQFILDNEGYNRDFYTGFLGEMNLDNETNLYVNLRCMKVENTNLFLFLGGGITKDSVAENEWYETIEKSKVIKRIL